MTNQVPFIDIHTHLRSWGVPRLAARALATILVPLVGKSRFEHGREIDDNQDDIIEALENGTVGLAHRTILIRLEKAMRKAAKSSLDDQNDGDDLEDMMTALEDLYGQYVAEKNTFILPTTFSALKNLEAGPAGGETPEILKQLDEILMPAFMDAAHHAQGNGYFEAHGHGSDGADADLKGFGDKAFPTSKDGTLLKML
ncbi:MAG: hypothetical protein P8X76_15240, partial [Maritimibacter sp.]